MSKSKEFFDVANSYLEKLRVTQKEATLEVAKIMGDCMINNGIVQLFGIDHGIAFSMELGYRAGGLMPFHRISVSDLVLRNVITESELTKPDFNMDISMAHKLLSIYNIHAEDMFIIISSAGNEPIVVEVALEAKKRNQKVVAILSKSHVDASPTLHSSGNKLSDLADVMLDVTASYPDLVVKLSDGNNFNQVSTICGNVIAQMLTAETYRYLKENGKDCPILLSANVKGADEHNRAISDKYLGRWNS